ncbi:MAG TPA: hypothetical protein VGI98_02115 [Candidatus Limnocylindrales bacterium]
MALLPETPWQLELHQLQPDGTRSLDSALRLFVMAFGPVPGVPGQAAAPGSIASATPAVEAIQAHLADLSAPQREAVQRYLAPATDGDPLVVPSPIAAGPAPAGAGRIVLAAAVTDIRAEAAADAAAAWNAAAAAYGNVGVNLAIEFSDATGGSFRTFLDFGGQGDTCELYVSTSAWDAAETRRALTFDVVHCFQEGFERAAAQQEHRDFAIGGEGIWSTFGAAEFIASTLWPPTAADTQAWLRYLLTPDIALFDRQEDAVGYYAQAKDDGLDMAEVLQGVLFDPSGGELQASSATAPDRFAGAGTATPTFLQAWASELSQTGWGPDWAIGAGWPTPAGVETPRDPLSISVGSTEVVDQAAYSNHLYAVGSQADIVEFDFEGYARVGDGHVDDTGLAPGYFCTTDKGCGPCPDGSDPSIQPVRLAPQSVLAVSGGTDGTTGTVSGHDLDEFCQASPPPSMAVQVKQIETIGGHVVTFADLLACDGPYGHWSGLFYGIENYSRPMSFDMGGGSGDVSVITTPGDGQTPKGVLKVSGDVKVAITNDATTMALSGTTDVVFLGPNGPLPPVHNAFNVSYPIEPADPGRCP